jgi:hypothetical protein
MRAVTTVCTIIWIRKNDFTRSPLETFGCCKELLRCGVDNNFAKDDCEITVCRPPGERNHFAELSERFVVENISRFGQGLGFA